MDLSRNIKLLSWFNFFFNFRLYSVIAIIYFSEVTDSYALGISIFSIAQLSQAFLEVPTGVISDKVGRVNTLRLGALLSILSVVFYAIGQFYWVLVIGAIFEGMFRAFFSGNNDALLYESVKQGNTNETYHSSLGKINSNLELAGFIAAAISGLIAFKSFSLLLWLSVLPQILAFAVSFMFIEPPIQRKVVGLFEHLKESLSYYRKSVKLRDISLAQIIRAGIGESTWALQSAFYNSVLPLWSVGFVMSLNFLASVISYRLAGRIINKFKELNLLIFQEFYSRILDIIALIHPTIISPFLMAAASIFYGAGEVARNSLLQKEFSDNQRATMASINSLLGTVFFAIFAVFLGALVDRIGLSRSLLFAQICLIPIVFLYIKAFRFDRKSKE